MRILPDGMQDRLDTGVTTLCTCWCVTRTDGLRFGFTDHDRPLAFDGVDYEPHTGFGAESIRQGEGFASDQSELAGAFDSAWITPASVEAGLWTSARVEIFQVDWTDPTFRVQIAVGEIGEIRRRGDRFEAELLSLSHRLNAASGRVFARACDAALGDARCRVAPDHPRWGAGCDQRFATCRDRFANTLNFRGFPYMVGNDVLQASPAGEVRCDGASRGLGG